VTTPDRPVPWQQAWHEALYGQGGFYRRPEGPAGHFRTACHAGPAVLAPALLKLATEAGCTAIVDVGAGRGELLTALAQLGPGAADQRVGLHGVDVVPRPPGLPDGIGWSCGLDALPDAELDGALVLAFELLDVVAVPIAELGTDGVPRIVLVDPATGEERPGPPLTAVESAWCARWWPLVDADPGARVEIGAPRDALWAGLVKRVARTVRGGLLLAVDYSHDLEHRPPGGSLAAFRGGRAVPPVLDGSCDLTAHVALDAVAAAGARAGATDAVLLRQRAALRALGAAITPGDLAAARSAGTAALLAQLELRSQLDELLDESGLGGFGWLVQGVRRPVPGALTDAGSRPQALRR
jgi:SAM-dependent MidA family methyltransferase